MKIYFWKHFLIQSFFTSMVYVESCLIVWLRSSLKRILYSNFDLNGWIHILSKKLLFSMIFTVSNICDARFLNSAEDYCWIFVSAIYSLFVCIAGCSKSLCLSIPHSHHTRPYCFIIVIYRTKVEFNFSIFSECFFPNYFWRTCTFFDSSVADNILYNPFLSVCRTIINIY